LILNSKDYSEKLQRRVALAYLENYRFWLWNKGYEKKVISINQLQKRCYDPKMALECVASSLGIV
jgi:hypothetical protein